MPISEPRSLDPHLGSVLQNRYRILAEIASGAMGVVYRGERVGLERRVAVKFLHPWIASQQAFLDRFDNEARAMSRLGHPNCVSVIDFGVEGEPYLVMDFVTGRTLRAVLNDGGRQPPSRALHVIRQLLSGLRHAHTQGIVHRDLKPENLILTDEAGLPDHLRILDFGLAKLRDGPATTTGLAIGTPSYMSPEQGGAEGATDARSDLYSVGVLLFELLTGRKPFESPNIGDVIFMHRETAAPRVRALAPEAGLSAELEAVIWKAMAKRQDDRFQSAAELADALDGTPEGSARRYVAYAVAPIPSAAAAPSNPCPVDATTVDATTVDATWPAPVPADETPRPRSSSRQFRFTRRDLIAGAGLVALGIVAVALEMFAR